MMKRVHRIHIVGISPRTGTTLLAECMAACFDIDAVEEHEAPLTEARAGASVHLTKKPQDLVIAERWLRTDAALDVICMIRDPRDVVVSRHNLRPDAYWVSLAIWLSRVGIVRALADTQRFLMVRYEDLVLNPDATQARIAEAMPFLAPRLPFTRFHEVAGPSKKALDAMGAVRPIGGERIGNWRRHLPRLAAQLERYGPIGDALYEFGYEPTDEWLSALAGIAPDFPDSVVPDDADRRYLAKLGL